MRRVLLACAAAIGWAGAASATPMIDQSDTVTLGLIGHFSAAGIAQSFTPSQTTSSGAGLFANSGAGNITIQLWDKLPNVAGASELAYATAYGGSILGSWVDVFWSPVAVKAGSTYYLVLSSDNAQQGILGDVLNTYSRGQAYTNGYYSFPNYDFAFREYADAAVPVAVPEPATLALLSLPVGVAGLIAARRRRNAA